MYDAFLVRALSEMAQKAERSARLAAITSVVLLALEGCFVWLLNAVTYKWLPFTRK